MESLFEGEGREEKTVKEADKEKKEEKDPKGTLAVPAIVREHYGEHVSWKLQRYYQEKNSKN